MLAQRATRIASTATVLLVTVICRGESPSNKKLTPAISAQNWNASALIGQKVSTLDLKEIGTLRELVMSPDGKIVYAAVSFEGFTKNDHKLYAVPMDAIYLTWKDNKIENARVDVDEEMLKQRTDFDKNHPPLFADSGFITRRDGPSDRDKHD